MTSKVQKGSQAPRRRAAQVRSVRRVALVIVLGLVVAACNSSTHADSTTSTTRAVGPPGAEVVSGGPNGSYVVPPGIHKIKHVIIIMQENRSFDSYFGTFPGADGIPMRNGVPTVCSPDPKTHQCIKPFVDHHDVNGGGPHGAISAVADINGGKMNGFVNQQRLARRNCRVLTNPACAHGTRLDVMGYHTQSDIPNYWTYAKDFVLQDHMFEPNASWSLPAHLFELSEWSAYCTNPLRPSSCVNNLQSPNYPGRLDTPSPHNPRPIYAWTDLTYVLHQHHVSWRYYVVPGYEPDCRNSEALACAPIRQSSSTPGIWNPLPYFTTVHQDHQLGDIQPVQRFYSAAKAGTLPSVTWVVPSGAVSEHPPAPVSFGQSYVTSLINAVMRSPDWKSSAIFLAWDDWGGFYDNVVPPKVDVNGYGLRVPSMVISPYAKRGYIDHQILSFDAFDKFIEDDFLNGERLNPLTDGRPDPRPDVRENAPILGNLVTDFNFGQTPLAPVILPVFPHTTLIGTPPPSVLATAAYAPTG